jgi:hypothetical protein
MNRLPVAKAFVIGCLTMNRLTMNRHHQTGLRLTRYWVVSDYPQTGLGLTMPRLPVAKPLTIAPLNLESTPLNRAKAYRLLGCE